VELATEPLPSPAAANGTTFPPGEKVAFSCGFTVRSLLPEGIDIVVEWWPGAFGSNVRARGGSRLTIDGRPARLALTTTPPVCELIGGSKLIWATVAVSPRRALQAFACLRGPLFSATEHQFTTMLRTMKFPTNSKG